MSKFSEEIEKKLLLVISLGNRRLFSVELKESVQLFSHFHKTVQDKENNHGRRNNLS